MKFLFRIFSESKKLQKLKNQERKKSKTQKIKASANFCEIKKMRKNSHSDQESNGSQSPHHSSQVNIQRWRRQILESPPHLESPQLATKYSSETHQQKPNLNGETQKHHSNKPQRTLKKKKQPTSNKQCRFWNYQRCDKQNCQYQQYSLKHLYTQTNPLLLNRENQIMEDENLLLIQITEICFVTKEQLNQIIEKLLLSESQKRTIAIGTTNKRRANQLKTSIKKEIQSLDDAQLQQFVTVDKFLNQIATVKNNLKNSSPKLINKNQINKNIEKQAKETNQLSYQQTQEQNKLIKSTKKTMDIEEQTKLRLPLQTDSIYMTKTSNIYQSLTPNEVQTDLSKQQSDIQIDQSQISNLDLITLKQPITLPNKNELIELTHQLSTQHNFFANKILPNNTYLTKLICRVSTQNSQIPNITVYISQNKAQDIYFKNLKDLAKNSSLAGQISFNLTTMTQMLWVNLRNLLKYQENEGDIKQIKDGFSYLLIPQGFSSITKRHVNKKQRIIFKNHVNTLFERTTLTMDLIIVQNKFNISQTSHK